MKSRKTAKAKLIVIIVLAVFAAIIFWQNREPIDAQILLLRIHMSRALLLMLTFVLGFLTGVLVTGNFLRRKK